MIDGVLEGALSAAFVDGPLVHPGLEGLPVFPEEMMIVAPYGHAPIARASEVNRANVYAFRANCSTAGILRAGSMPTEQPGQDPRDGVLPWDAGLRDRRRGPGVDPRAVCWRVCPVISRFRLAAGQKSGAG